MPEAKARIAEAMAIVNFIVMNEIFVGLVC